MKLEFNISRMKLCWNFILNFFFLSFEGMREILKHFANVSTNDVVGMRAPYLKPGRNAQYKVSPRYHYHHDDDHHQFCYLLNSSSIDNTIQYKHCTTLYGAHFTWTLYSTCEMFCYKICTVAVFWEITNISNIAHTDTQMHLNSLLHFPHAMPSRFPWSRPRYSQILIQLIKITK